MFLLTNQKLTKLDIFGHFRVASAVPLTRVADTEFNIERIIECISTAAADGADAIVFPELSITSYTCGDLFNQQLLLDKAEEGLLRVAAATLDSKSPSCVIVGAPLRKEGSLFNCAIVISNGEIKGVVPKSFIPNYNEFYEKRWFTSGRDIRSSLISINGNDVPFGTDLLFKIGHAVAAIEICEDLWVTIPPSSCACLHGAEIVFNLSATDEVSGKHDYLRSLIAQQSARCRAAYVYSSAGFGESTTDLVFSGNAIIAEDGVIMRESPRFTAQRLYEVVDIDVERLRGDRRHFNSFADNTTGCRYNIINCKCPDSSSLSLLRKPGKTPFVPAAGPSLDDRCREIISIQTEGLMKRLAATSCKNLVIGISGGLDSTLALLVAVNAFNRLQLPTTGIHAITMPGFGTTERTHNNAHVLMKELGVTAREIPIAPAVTLHFSDIGHDPDNHDVVYENSQARERTQILMDIANQTNGMVLGTGDLSELALGWATYNGDQMSMYGVNASVPKTLVRHLVRWFATQTDNSALSDALLDVVNTPVSPELLPADTNGEIRQKTEDLVGPYELHDFFLFHLLRYGFSPEKIFMLACKAFEDEYSAETILHWMRTFYRRFFSQQLKRSCMPDGPKVGSVCLSPRGDWRMPSDASASLWLKSIDNIMP